MFDSIINTSNIALLYPAPKIVYIQLYSTQDTTNRNSRVTHIMQYVIN